MPREEDAADGFRNLPGIKAGFLCVERRRTEGRFLMMRPHIQVLGGFKEVAIGVCEKD